jgi:hypothetical protein
MGIPDRVHIGMCAYNSIWIIVCSFKVIQID